MTFINGYAAIMTACVIAAIAIVRWCVSTVRRLEAEAAAEQRQRWDNIRLKPEVIDRLKDIKEERRIWKEQREKQRKMNRWAA